MKARCSSKKKKKKKEEEKKRKKKKTNESKITTSVKEDLNLGSPYEIYYAMPQNYKILGS